LGLRCDHRRSGTAIASHSLGHGIDHSRTVSRAVGRIIRIHSNAGGHAIVGDIRVAKVRPARAGIGHDRAGIGTFEGKTMPVEITAVTVMGRNVGRRLGLAVVDAAEIMSHFVRQHRKII